MDEQLVVPANLRQFKIELGKAILTHSMRVMFNEEPPAYLLKGANVHIDAAERGCVEYAPPLLSLAAAAQSALRHFPGGYEQAVVQFTQDLLATYRQANEFLDQVGPDYILRLIADSIQDSAAFEWLLTILVEVGQMVG